jgi:hypothetical protein
LFKLNECVTIVPQFAGGETFSAFHAETSFLPFGRGLGGLTQLPLLAVAIGIVASLFARWLHPGPLWP